MAASSCGGNSSRRTHFTAILLPVARCVPRHTVAKEPDFSFICFEGDSVVVVVVMQFVWIEIERINLDVWSLVCQLQSQHHMTKKMIGNIP